jgi:hypothetical protein
VADVPDRLTAARRIGALTGAGISTGRRCVVREPIGTAVPRLVARD